nr:retrovirus-related Pol polyprotein from transposon TNT 1-94 [Tanacetum cinerariifolium]
PPPLAPFVPPSRKEWDLTFQLVFDEFYSPPASVASPVPVEEAPAPIESTDPSSSTTVDQDAPSPKHSKKWTKDHPSQNIIDELSRPVSTRLQLHEQALFCYYDAFLTLVEPKTHKEALTQSYWIEAMQEKLHGYERLEVWELIPPLNKVMVVTLKWIYKVKLDEFGEILKNKARLEVVRIFLAFAAHMNMIVYQMDVKMAFLIAFCMKRLHTRSMIYCHRFYYLKNSPTARLIPHCSLAEKAKISS